MNTILNEITKDFKGCEVIVKSKSNQILSEKTFTKKYVSYEYVTYYAIGSLNDERVEVLMAKKYQNGNVRITHGGFVDRKKLV
jgi:hypothetical protein